MLEIGRTSMLKLTAGVSLAGLILGVLLLVHYSGLDLRWGYFGTGDFLAYWSVPRSLLLGHGMYAPHWSASIQSGFGFTGFRYGETVYRTMPLWNPPPIVLLLLPVAALSLPSAVVIWLTLGTTTYLIASLYFVRTVQPRVPIPAAIVLALAGIPLFTASFLGQPTPFLVASLIFAWSAQRRGRSVAAGILLVPLLLKFHLFSPSVFLMLWLETRHRRFVLIGTLVVGLAMLAATLFILDPGWYGGWRAQGISAAPTYAPWDLAVQIFRAPAWVRSIPFFGGLLIVVWRFRHHAEISPRDLAEASLLGVLFCPYLWDHDIVALAPTVLWLGAQLWTTRWRLSIGIAILHRILSPLYVTPHWPLWSQLAREIEGLPNLARLTRMYSTLIVILIIWWLAIRQPDEQLRKATKLLSR